MNLNHRDTKRIGCVLLFSCFFLIAHAQDVTQNNQASYAKQELLKKSKDQKTGGLLLLGTGAALIAIAAPGEVSLDLLPIIAIGSATCIISGMSLLIASGRN